MADRPNPALIEAARAICREAGLDPDAVISSSYGAPAHWEGFLPHARAAGVAFAETFRTLAEVARAAAMQSEDQIEAERLKARADALHEAARLVDEVPPATNVVEFRRL